VLVSLLPDGVLTQSLIFANGDSPLAAGLYFST